MGEVRNFRLWAMLLGVFCLWLYGAGHARYGLFDVDEGVFTQATVEMRHSGSLAMPTYNGEPRYHKPPLIYWTQDAMMSVLGEDSLYAARLPSALGALLTILLLGWGVMRLTGDRLWGLASAAAMGLNLSFVVVGRAATADGLLNLTSLALALWLVHVCYPQQAVLPRAQAKADVLAERMRVVAARATYWRWQWLVTAVLAALAFLAKGPVAWLPAMLVAGAVLWARRERGEVWARLSPVKAGLMTLALLVPWVLLLVRTHGLGFFYEFFIVHNIGRYAGGLSNTQSSSHFYYLGVVLVGFFPWVLLLPTAMRQVVRSGWRSFKTTLASRDVSRALPALAMVWAVGYVLFFSFSQTKLAHYIVPAYPALAILAGWFLAHAPRRRVPAWQMAAGVLLGLVLAGIMLMLDPLLMGLRQPVLEGWLGWLQAATGFAWPLKDKLAMAVLAQPVPLDNAPYAVAWVLALAVLPAWVMVAQARRGGLPLLTATWGICLALVAWGVVPMVWQYTQAPLARLAMAMGREPRTTPVVHLGLHKPSVLYLSGRHFLKLEKPLQLPDYITAPEMLVLTEQPTVGAIVTELGTKGTGQVLGQRCDGGYCLLLVAKLGAPLPE